MSEPMELDNPEHGDRTNYDHSPSSTKRPGSDIAYNIPALSLIAVEHPCIIKNPEHLEKALGGQQLVSKIVSIDNSEPARAYLKPNDPMSRPLFSKHATTDDILLRVTVPKLVGRRKRAAASSSQASQRHEDQMMEVQDVKTLRHAMSDSQRLLQALRDNDKHYTIETVGRIEKTHRFRSLADFQYSVSRTVFVERVKDHFTDLDFEKIRSFQMIPEDGVQPQDEIMPPPFFTKQELPFQYNYEQNPAMRLTTDSAGNPLATSRNKKLPPIQTTSALFEDIPTGPSEQAAHESELDDVAQRVLAAGRELLARRPIWTRRALHNTLGINKNSDLSKRVIPYLGYSVRAGAWKDTVVKFGVNPSSDPAYRKYQSLTFLSFYEEAPVMKQQGSRKDAADKGKEKDQDTSQSHIFDGQTVSLDSKTWQICDITDPFIKALAVEAPVAEKCDVVTGWYNNGGLAKIKQVMRHKITSILENNGSAVTDISLQFVHEIPDSIELLKAGEKDDQQQQQQSQGPRNPAFGGGDPQKQLEMQLSGAIRGVARQDTKNSIAIRSGAREIGMGRHPSNIDRD